MQPWLAFTAGIILPLESGVAWEWCVLWVCSPVAWTSILGLEIISVLLCFLQPQHLQIKTM